MKKLLSALTTLTLAMPASATPRAFDNGLLVEDPMFGLARLETVVFCLNEAGVDRYQDLLTDTEFDIYEGCMIEHE